MGKHTKYSHILWDWNGTLLDDVTASINSINVSLKKYGLPLLDKQRYFEIFCFPVKKYYKRLGFDLSKYEELAQEFIDNYLIESYNSTLQQEAEKTLNYIKKLGIKQSILSASERQVLIDKLDLFNISKYFEDILALDNIYAESKMQIGLEWIKNRHNSDKVLLVGDSIHDYEVASQMNIDCILFSGGHGLRKNLANTNTIVIDNLSQLRDYIYLNIDRA